MADRVVSPLERERHVVTGLLVLQILLWLGFIIHRSPRFPGSVSGTTLGILGSALMVLPSLAYVAVKRIPAVKRWVPPGVPLRKLLAWHVYGGIFGSVLAVLHAGHRFESTLGLVLTGVMLLTVFSGYVGRYFLSQLSLDLREKQAYLGELMTAYNGIAARLAVHPKGVTIAASQSRWFRLGRRLGLTRSGENDESLILGSQAVEVASSIADLEYAIKTHDHFKRRFATWLTVHILGSLVFYALLGLHIWASFYFGLRWLV
jgi:hypothetical protein